MRRLDSRGHRGHMLATLLWILPFTLFGFSLAWDYNQAIAVTREATLTAEAMANAGATAFSRTQYSGDTALLDPPLAWQRANEMYYRALSSGMLRKTSATSGVRITPTTTYVAVEVPVETRMSLASLLVAILRPGSPPITVNTVGRARTDICVPTPGDGTVDSGVYCVYPTTDL